MAYLAEGEVGLVESIKADYVAYRDFLSVSGKSSLRSALNVLTWTMFHAVVIFRLSRAAQRAGLFPLTRLLVYLNEALFFIELSPHAIVGPGLVVIHPGCGCAAGTRIGRNCKMVMHVVLGVGGYSDTSRDGAPVIGDDVNLLAYSSVWGPVTVGSRSVIGLGVRLMKSVPEDSAVFAPQRQIVTKRPGAGEAAGDADGDESTSESAGD